MSRRRVACSIAGRQSDGQRRRPAVTVGHASFQGARPLSRLFWIGDPAVPENREILENHLIVPLTLFVKISERLSQIERNLLISSIQFLNMIS